MKKIVASVLVKNQIVVNSTNFNVYRPIGSLDQIITRLQEWEVDEIAVLNLTHSGNPLEDFHSLFPSDLLNRVNTPLAYGGGITTRNYAESVIAAGCERVILSGTRWTPEESRSISYNLGDQAVLIHLPLFQNGSEISLQNLKTPAQEFFADIPEEISIMSRGVRAPILIGGGVSTFRELEVLLEMPDFKGVVVGNWFNRKELVIPIVKSRLSQSGNLRSLVGFNQC
jgi:imidazole glycerol phosphate synthase subunit HisF